MSDASILESDMAQTGVGNVANEDPPDFEDTFPFVRRPHRAAAAVIDLRKRGLMSTTGKRNRRFTYSRQHLGHATEVAARRSNVDRVRDSDMVDKQHIYLAFTLKKR